MCLELLKHRNLQPRPYTLECLVSVISDEVLSGIGLRVIAVYTSIKKLTKDVHIL